MSTSPMSSWPSGCWPPAAPASWHRLRMPSSSWAVATSTGKVPFLNPASAAVRCAGVLVEEGVGGEQHRRGHGEKHRLRHPVDVTQRDVGAGNVAIEIALEVIGEVDDHQQDRQPGVHAEQIRLDRVGQGRFHDVLHRGERDPQEPRRGELEALAHQDDRGRDRGVLGDADVLVEDGAPDLRPAADIAVVEDHAVLDERAAVHAHPAPEQVGRRAARE